MAKEDHDSLLGYRAAIQEMEALRKDQDETLQSAKTTARQVLNSASLILGLMGVLQILISTPSWANLYWGVLGLIALLYIILIVCCAWVTLMTKTFTPIKADETEINKYLIMAENELDLLRKRLSAYLNVIHKNRDVITRKAFVANISVVILAAIVILLVGLGIFTKIIP